MTFLGELRVHAIPANLRLISHFVHGIAHRLTLSEKVLFDLELAVEEAATNVIHHAYPDGAKGDMLLRAATTGDFVEITIVDWGEAFDPNKVKPFDINAPVETRIKGGMGLHFIHNLTDRVERGVAMVQGQANVLKLYKLIEHASAMTPSSSAVQELNAMRTVSEVMTSNINLDDLLSLILNKLVQTIHAERGTIYLVDEDAGELWSRVLPDDVGPLEEIRVPIGTGIAGHVAATGDTLNIPDVYADERFNPDFDKVTGYVTRSMLTAPMFNPQQKVIGVVQLLNKAEGPFTFRDERLLSAMTSQAAISIENARLYQQELATQVLSRELETAHNIQASFLPDVIPTYEGWDIGALWCPIRNVAGDFYDFYELQDGRFVAAIADVSGKGIPAALFMALSVTVLRFGMMLNLAPHEVTRRANEMIISEQRSRMFATTWLSYISPHTGEMLYSSGGHNPSLVYRSATGECEYISVGGVAVGIFKGAEYELGRTTLQPGDVLVLYTDGITEVINTDEDEFGEERLEELVARYADRPAQHIADLILEAVNEFAGEQALFDDATLVIVKRTNIVAY